jgi:hypothetical protein
MDKEYKLKLFEEYNKQYGDEGLKTITSLSYFCGDKIFEILDKREGRKIVLDWDYTSYDKCSYHYE